MLTHWNELDRTARDFELLRRQLGGLFDGQLPIFTEARAQSTLPKMSIRDAGDQFLIEAVVPGLSEKDIKLSLNRNVLTLSGERHLQQPQGYGVQRRERGNLKFTRAISLPSPVDPERVQAKVKDGLLHVEIGKAKESQPKQIAVEAV